MFKGMEVVDNVIDYRMRSKGVEMIVQVIHDFGDKRIEMWSCDKFHDVQKCPNQRDTKGRAKKALNKHLKQASTTHNEVAIAELPDGTQYKLDGHTRDYMWYKNMLKKPVYLIVMVYKLKTIKDVRDIYYQYDNSNAVETNTDKLYGAYNQFNFKPKSKLMRGPMTSVLGAFFRKEDKADAEYMINSVFSLLKYMEIADDYNFDCSKETSSAPFKAALINAIINDGDDFDPEFWRGLFYKGTEEKNGKRNYIGHALNKCEHLESKSAGSVFPQIVNILTHSYERYKKKGNILVSSCNPSKTNKYYITQQILEIAQL